MAIDNTILRLKINDFVRGKLQGKSSSSDMSVYSSQDPYFNGIGKFIRNPTCWLNGVRNISCFSPAQMSGANWWQRGGTLITSKHVLFAKHFVTSVLPNGGTPLIFVDDNNNVARRNIIQYAYVPWTDVGIALLNDDVPSNIKIAKVLPKNHTQYMSIFDPTYCVGLDQQERAIVKVATGGSLYGVSYNGETITYRMFGVNESHPSHEFQSFNETIITGDSGNPVFYIIDNELVVATTWWFPTGGPFVSDPAIYDSINTQIESLSPGEGYAMTDVDMESAYYGMRRRYFDPDGDGSWSNLSNWYQDEFRTVPSASLPSSSDLPVLPWKSSSSRVVHGSAVLSFF